MACLYGSEDWRRRCLQIGAGTTIGEAAPGGQLRMDLEKLYDLLTRQESNRLWLYDDAQPAAKLGPGYTIKGHLTIGVGYNLEANPIPLNVSRMLLQFSVEKIIAALRRTFTWFDALNEVRQSVCISMAFNMGFSNFCGFSKMLTAINDQRWGDAAKEMLDSDAARKLPGRYVPMAMAMDTGKWPETI